MRVADAAAMSATNAAARAAGSKILRIIVISVRGETYIDEVEQP